MISAQCLVSFIGGRSFIGKPQCTIPLRTVPNICWFNYGRQYVVFYIQEKICGCHNSVYGSSSSIEIWMSLLHMDIIKMEIASGFVWIVHVFHILFRFNFFMLNWHFCFLCRIIPDVSDLKIKRDKISRQDVSFMKKVIEWKS